MTRAFAVLALFIATVLLYRYALRQAFGYLPMLIMQPGLLHAARDLGGFSMLRALSVVSDLLIYAVVSAPFAILFAWLHPKRWLPFAAAVSCLAALENIVEFGRVWKVLPLNTWLWTYISIGFVLLIATLPTMTYLAHEFVSKRRVQS